MKFYLLTINRSSQLILTCRPCIEEITFKLILEFQGRRRRRYLSMDWWIAEDNGLECAREKDLIITWPRVVAVRRCMLRNFNGRIVFSNFTSLDSSTDTNFNNWGTPERLRNVFSPLAGAAGGPSFLIRIKWQISSQCMSKILDKDWELAAATDIAIFTIGWIFWKAIQRDSRDSISVPKFNSVLAKSRLCLFWLEKYRANARNGLVRKAQKIKWDFEIIFRAKKAQDSEPPQAQIQGGPFGSMELESLNDWPPGPGPDWRLW
jgi:hypothetical protein